MSLPNPLFKNEGLKMVDCILQIFAINTTQVLTLNDQIDSFQMTVDGVAARVKKAVVTSSSTV